jgi:RNA-directed DNA polymerase
VVWGAVVNVRTNVARREYDLLKAILQDATGNGPVVANRSGVPDFRAHLLGRIAWIEQLNPRRGQRLRARLREIAWS